ncbi:DNA repair protein RadA [Catonella massiliensis]|jgi:DNA repair protein radA|uniref:DNA repair protein RadA n=1 Tax=Catonella massiliensis TaxID=2799636 RepID=A0ABS1J1B1_9FIRM|nr:DNA repair protein RadA [Catonella massiliensis]MBK5897931.1 DNA repair protein RadA [Catonella massiliensis]
MAKSKTVFFCGECGYESAKWLGQCPVCKAWNAFSEAPAIKKGGSSLKPGVAASLPIKIKDVSLESDERVTTGISELDRVLGGGIVKGSLVLVGGDPGIGKSTLLLQMCAKLSDKNVSVLYVSGEESERQIAIRSERLGRQSSDMLLYCETDIEKIEAAIENGKPEVVIVDSIQTMYSSKADSAAGSISQVREVTSTLLRISKGLGVSVFIVGHVTKEGTVAGPRTLEHMVDTVLYFEGEDVASYRILRAVKNRFGSTNEVGVFDMGQTGLREVANPSEYMLKGMPENAPGSVVACTMEGSRPILVEVQALVCQTNFNFPKRTTAGADYNRVNILIAVLEKRLGLNLGNCDAYVNVAGGLKINEPALDLAIVAALISSYRNRESKGKIIAFGEVGLTGEVRGVNLARLRLEEIAKFGENLVIIPKVNYTKDLPFKVLPVSNVRELMDII